MAWPLVALLFFFSPPATPPTKVSLIAWMEEAPFAFVLYVQLHNALFYFANFLNNTFPTPEVNT